MGSSQSAAREDFLRRREQYMKDQQELFARIRQKRGDFLRPGAPRRRASSGIAALDNKRPPTVEDTERYDKTLDHKLGLLLPDDTINDQQSGNNANAVAASAMDVFTSFQHGHPTSAYAPPPPPAASSAAILKERVPWGVLDDVRELRERVERASTGRRKIAFFDDSAEQNIDKMHTSLPPERTNTDSAHATASLLRRKYSLAYQRNQAEDVSWIHWDDDHQHGEDHRVAIDEDVYNVHARNATMLKQQSSAGSRRSSQAGPGGGSSMQSVHSSMAQSLAIQEAEFPMMPGAVQPYGEDDEDGAQWSVSLPPLPPRPWKTMQELRVTSLKSTDSKWMTALLVIKPHASGTNEIVQAYGAVQQVFKVDDPRSMLGRPTWDFLTAPPDNRGRNEIYFPYALIIESSRISAPAAMSYCMNTEVVVLCQGPYKGLSYTAALQIVPSLGQASYSRRVPTTYTMKVVARFEQKQNALDLDARRLEMEEKERVVESARRKEQAQQAAIAELEWDEGEPEPGDESGRSSVV